MRKLLAHLLFALLLVSCATVASSQTAEAAYLDTNVEFWADEHYEDHLVIQNTKCGIKSYEVDLQPNGPDPPKKTFDPVLGEYKEGDAFNVGRNNVQAIVTVTDGSGAVEKWLIQILKNANPDKPDIALPPVRMDPGSAKIRTMLTLPRLTSRGLAITDWFLGQWVHVDTGTHNSACYSFPTYNATVNPCGLDLTSNVTDIIESIVSIVPSILGSLFAFG